MNGDGGDGIVGGDAVGADAVKPRGAGTTGTAWSGTTTGGGAEERRADLSGILKNQKCESEQMCQDVVM